METARGQPNESADEDDNNDERENVQGVARRDKTEELLAARTSHVAINLQAKVS